MSETPRVWVLLGKGTGGNGQMKSLAEALGWPYETKDLVYNRWERLPNLLLGDSGRSLDRRRSSSLEPPWPDLVIGGSRRSAPIARWIKRQSGGATRLVHLMHTLAPLDAFDLVVTTPQYKLPELPNVLHNSVPLNDLPRERLAAAARQWAPRLAHLPRPWVALLAGGNSSSYRLDAEVAERVGRDVGKWVRDLGGALLLTTSARTPEPAADALLAAIDCPGFLYRWRGVDPDNPYLGFLALADRFVVTIDSASLAAEAAAAGKEVAVYRWPVRADKQRGLPGLMRRIAAARDRAGAAPGTLSRLYDRLVYLGLVKPPRDFDAYFENLRRRGRLRYWDESPRTGPAEPLDDLGRTVERIRSLFESGAPRLQRAAGTLTLI